MNPVKFLSDLCRAVFVAVILHAVSAHAQLSPGDLAAAHARLEGLSNCTSCHELGKGPSAAKCLECHKAVAGRIEAKQGYHHNAVTVQQRACFHCHSDHAGRDFELINWPGGEPSLNHTLVGFELTGAHAKLKCRQCHKQELIRQPLQSIEPDLNLSRTFLGLQTACLDCHQDQHKGKLGSDCLKCHTQDKWKPATAFDHDQTRFKLTGKHQQVTCTKCHLVGGKADTESAVYQYKDLKFANCTDCHKDTHKGKFGNNCTKCHQTTGWRDLLNNDFDHDKTAFPLKGRHTKVDCTKCHATGSLLAGIKHEACTDCHKDIHRGQFAARADGGKCDACHSVDGFMPARFTVEDHNRGDFALQGAHLAQPCIACHTELPAGDTPAYRLFVFSDTRCPTCHEDRHDGQFVKSEPVKLCDRCHGSASWALATFDHDRTPYPLTGKHRDVACASCHPRSANENQVVYRGVSHKCESCHLDTDNLPALDGDKG